MRRLALAVLIAVSLGVSSCSPAGQSPAEAISRAKTVSELDALVNRFFEEQEFDAALAAAEKAIEIDPQDIEHYIAAVSVIRQEADVKFERARTLLESASRIASEAADQGNPQELDSLAAWVEDNRPQISWGLPSVPDYTSPDQINPAGNTAGNLMNRGRAAGQGDWVYYVSKKSGGTVRKMRTDGAENSVCIQQAVISFEVAGDWIYYSAMDTGVSLYRAHLDDTGATLLDSSPKCVNMNIVDDRVYFVIRVEGDRNSFVSIGVDGTGREVFSDVSGDEPDIVGDWMYYINRDDGGQLYRMHLDGSENQRVPN